MCELRTYCRFLTWGILIAAACACGGLYVFHTRIHEEVRKGAEAKLRSLWPHLGVRVAAARLVEGQGFELRGIRLHDPDEPERPILEIEEVFVAAVTDLQDLLSKQIKIRQLIVRRPRLHVFKGRTGAWSFLGLVPAPGSNTKPPRVVVEGGACLLGAPADGGPPLWTLREMASEIRLACPDYPLTESLGECPLTLRAELKAHGDCLRQFSVQVFQDTAGAWSIRAELQGLEIGPELRSLLPLLHPSQERLPDIRGLVSAVAEFRREAGAAAPWNYRVVVDCDRGSVHHARLDHPLRDIAARAVFTPEGAVLESLVLRHQTGTLSLQGQSWGYKLDSPLQLRGELKDFSLSDQWSEWLPEKLRRYWEDYSPTGRVDARLAVTFDGRQWLPDAEVTCREVTFCYVKFPYRLTRGHGRIRWTGDRLTGNLTCMGGGQPLEIEFRFLRPGPETESRITLRGRNLQTDRQLWLALPPRPSQISQSLNPEMKFHLDTEITRPAGPRQPIEVRVNGEILNGSVRFDPFPYPVENIVGNFVGTGQIPHPDAAPAVPPGWRWEFRNLVGRNNGGTMQGTAVVLPPAEGGRFRLDLTATDVPLDQEMRDALPPKVRNVWKELRPSGTADADIVVICDPGARPDIGVVVRPRDATIEPLRFPYRLENLTGKFTYGRDQVLMEDIRAVHGPVKVRGAGNCRWDASGEWRLHLEKFWAERIRFDRTGHDRELFPALPAGLRRALEMLEVGGPANISGEWELAGSPRLPGNVLGAWDLTLDCHRMSIKNPLPLGGIYGTVKVRGAYDGESSFAHGDIELDSLDQENYQFTQVRGPYWLDGTQIVFGSLEGLTPRDPKVPLPTGERHLTAKFAGGTVIGDAHVVLADPPRYHVRTSLMEADLARYAQEFIPGPQTSLSGRLNGNFELRGTGAGRHTWQGTGAINLSDARIYELPVMLALLRIASLREPKDSVFSAADIRCRIVGPYVYFDQLDFRGEAMSVRGSGSMNLQQEIALEFYTVVGQDRFRVPGIDQLLGGTAQQLLQIRVDGSLQDPRTTREILPLVSDALQQLFKDLGGRPIQAPVQAARLKFLPGAEVRQR